MNIVQILITIAALIGGGIAGITLTGPEETPEQSIANEITPLPEDFLSVRPLINALPSEALSSEETADLIFTREEEKLARDVYRTLYETWGLQIFSNIAQSEQTHTEAVRTLLEKYGLEDPVTNDAVGAFTNETIAGLYASLTERGRSSLTEALTVGALIEDLDINDVESAKLRSDNEDIQLVYDNLIRGSRNHIRSFTMQLTRNGTTYEPSYISAEAYEGIITSERERGTMLHSGTGANQSRGRGWGNGF